VPGSMSKDTDLIWVKLSCPISEPLGHPVIGKSKCVHGLLVSMYIWYFWNEIALLTLVCI
jgi:hypothetical protein